MLERTIDEGEAPTFAALLERGNLVPDCVSSFPSVTPVACAEMVTGVAADRHWISGMNWYHRLERRYVEYGSSLEATRSVGVFRALYDLVYNMNLAHLSPEVPTLFETPRRRRRPHRLHPVPDLPRPPSAPGLARGADEADAGRRRPAQIRPPHLGPARPLLRRPLRQPRGPLQVDIDPRQPRHLRRLLRRRARQGGRLRLPPPLAARQRQPLPPPRARGERRVDRQGRRIVRPAGRRDRAGSTGSSRTTP